MEGSEPPRLPGLELLRPIGRGSFGEVWLARTVTGQYRAVKLVPLGAEGSGLQALGERVFRGVQAYLGHLPPGSAAALAVLHVDRDPDGRFLYYVMELADDVAGGRSFAPEHYQALTLSESRRRSPGQFVPAEETIRLGRQLAEGLAALHAAGLVHRDIKPNNVVFIGGEPRLADIDLVRPAEASLSAGGAQGYSPLEGPGRPTADVFSLARTLYVTVTGLPVGEFPRLPEDWDRRPDAPALRRLNAVLLRASDRDPARRHPNAAAFAEDLRRLELGEDVEFEETRRIKTRRLAAVTTAFLALVALTAALLIPAYRQRSEQAKFERYREQVASVAANIQRTDEPLTNAINVLTEMLDSQIETRILFRQALRAAETKPVTTSTSAITFPTPETPPELGLEPHTRFSPMISTLVISPDDAYIAVLIHSTAYTYSLSSRKHCTTITNVSALIGFAGKDNYLVGLRQAAHGSNSVVLWDSDTGKHVASSAEGNWISAGIVTNGPAVALTDHNGAKRLLHFWPIPFLSGRSMVPWSESVEGRFPESVGQQIINPFNAFVSSARITSDGNRIVWSDTFLEPFRTVVQQGAPQVSPPDASRRRTFVSAMRVAEPKPRWLVTEGAEGLDDDFRFAFSSDETWIATESASTLRLKPVKGNANVELPLPSGAIWAVNGGSRPLVAVADSTGISVVDAQSRSIVQHLPARDRWFTSLAWSKDIPLLAIGDWDGKVTLWNVGWGASWRFGNINNMIDTVWVGSAHHLPDCNRSLVFAENLAGDDSVKISGCNVFRRISVQSSNRREASVGFGDIGGEVHLNWSGHKCQVLVSVNDETSWGCDSSGRLLMARGRLSSNEGDINGGQPHNIFATYAGLDREARGARGVAVNGGKHIAIFVSDQLAIWKLESASARRVVEVCHPTSATFADVASGSNPRFAVVLADEGSALLADLDTGATRLLKQLNEKAVTACFRPDSTECYFGTSGGRLLRLDTATDDPPELLDANFGLPAHMIATPDGERLFTAGPGEQLGIRRLSDGAPIVQLTHHGLALQSGRHNLKRLLYLPKQQRVISLSEDGWLSQW